MKILDQMCVCYVFTFRARSNHSSEHLKMVPDLLETLISEKRLLQAAILLVRSLKIINNPDMLDVGAVSDLRNYLLGQESVSPFNGSSGVGFPTIGQALKDILIDELHAHLYLKSFWCESRWSAYVPGQQTCKPNFRDDLQVGSYATGVPRTGYEEVVIKGENNSKATAAQNTRLQCFLTDLALKPNDPPHDLNEPHSSAKNRNGSQALNVSPLSATVANPEADSFAYLELLLESLAVLGKLATALDTVSQRLPTEIFSLVENTVDEVEERAEYGRRMTTITTLEQSDIYTSSPEVPLGSKPLLVHQHCLSSAHLRLAALESFSKRGDHEILRDLFWTLYSKLDAVGQGIRVVSEVANRIGAVSKSI